MSRNVYKKSSPNSKVTVYLNSRDIMDDLSTVDPLEGVVLVTDPEYLKERRVFARLNCEFRYGAEVHDDIMTGVVFAKEFHLQVKQVYPQSDNTSKLSEIQDRLIRKFNGEAFPFHFDLPHDIPPSVMLQSGDDAPPDTKPCGITYSLQVFVGDDENSQISRHNSVSIIIRRLTASKPSPSTTGVFHESTPKKYQSPGSSKIKMEASLPTDIFHHQETIPITLVVDNMSNSAINRIKVQVVQIAEVTVFRPQTFRTVIFERTEEGGEFPIAIGKIGWCRIVKLRPSLSDNHKMAGLALDGMLRNKENTLASSTLVKDFRKKDQLAIIVHYIIRIKAVCGFGSSDVEMELPFVLTHPHRSTMEDPAVTNKMASMNLSSKQELA